MNKNKPQTSSKTVVSFGTPSTSVDVLYQDMGHLFGVVDDLASQVQRIQRTFKIDQAEGAVAEKKSRDEMIDAIGRNTQALSMLVEMQAEERRKDDGEDRFFYRMRDDRSSKKKENLKWLRVLMGLKRRVEDSPCTCGKHKSIAFLDKDGGIVTSLCPVSIWISMSRLAYEDGHLSSFTSSTPLDKYVRPYIIKKNS